MNEIQMNKYSKFTYTTKIQHKLQHKTTKSQWLPLAFT